MDSLSKLTLSEEIALQSLLQEVLASYIPSYISKLALDNLSWEVCHHRRVKSGWLWLNGKVTGLHKKGHTPQVTPVKFSVTSFYLITLHFLWLWHSEWRCNSLHAMTLAFLDTEKEQNINKGTFIPTTWGRKKKTKKEKKEKKTTFDLKHGVLSLWMITLQFQD